MNNIVSVGERLTQQALDSLVENGLLSQDFLDRARNNYPDLSQDKFNREFLRAIALDNFVIFAHLLDLPILRNPIYKDYIDRIDVNQKAVNKLWRSYHRTQNIEEKTTIHKEILQLKSAQKSITLCMIPRGALKTTLLICARSAYLYLRDTIIQRRPPIIMLLHGNVKKAEQNKKLVNDFFHHPVIQHIFCDVLQVEKNTSSRLRFADESDIKRKEDHIMAGSAGQEFGGEHATYYMVDDWALRTNVDTPDKNQSNIEAFHALRWLNDHSGNFRIEMVGTHYTDDTIYCWILNHPEEVESCIVGATTRLSDGSVKYNFEEIPDYTKERLEVLKKITPHDQYMSQVEMIPYSRGSSMKLADELPLYQSPYDLIYSGEEEKELVALTVDPANSKKHKNSTLVIHAVLITKSKKVFVMDTFSSVGTTPTDFRNAIFTMANRHKADYVIIESIAAQLYMSRDITEEQTRRRREISKGERKPAHLNFTVIEHRHHINKAIHYKNFLEPLISQGKLFINPTSDQLIAQIEGRSSLEDEIDCLSFLIELRIDYSDEQEILTAEQQYEMEYIQYRREKPTFDCIGWI